jgi:hypothetical protein
MLDVWQCQQVSQQWQLELLALHPESEPLE